MFELLDEEEVEEDVLDIEGVLFTLHNFLPFAGGRIFLERKCLLVNCKLLVIFIFFFEEGIIVSFFFLQHTR